MITKVQETTKYRDEDEGEQAVILNTQIHKPRFTDVKRESESTTEVAAQKAVESHNEVQKVVKVREYPRSTSSKAMMPTLWARRRKTYKAASKKSEHSTARSRLRGPRRVQVHVHGGRGVDGDAYDQCENHVGAETESSE